VKNLLTVNTKKKIVYGLFIISIIFSFLIQSCVPSKPIHEKKILPAGRLIKKIEANRRKVKTFYGKGNIDIKTESFEGSAGFEIKIHKPDSIRLNIYGPFGIDLAQAMVTRNRFLFYDVLHDQAYSGNLSMNIMKKIFKIDLPFNQLIDAFAGAVNLTSQLSRRPDKFEIGNDYYDLIYNGNPKSKKYFYKIRIDNNALVQHKIELSNSLLFVSRYFQFEEIEEIPIPHKAVIENKVDKQVIIIEYRSIEINKKLDEMTLKLPSDVRIKRL